MTDEHHSSSIDGQSFPKGSARRSRELPFSAPWARVAARVFAPSLDAKLAVSQDPDVSEVLSARAQLLTSTALRHSVANSYLDLVVEAHTPRSPYSRFDAAVPVVRRRVIATEALIRDVASALVGPLPRVRGVALAISLLRDGAGPLFNPGSNSSLSSALKNVLRQIDPLESTIF